jgi:nicotinamide-nucleotide amidase
VSDPVTALAKQLGDALKARGLMVTVAESCTGGGVGEAITRIPGSSAWFDRGYITYTNEAKAQMLGVSPATLGAHGAVSEPTAREMLEGAVARSEASLGVAVTGIAGPDGGSVDKPVGLVYFAWGGKGATPRVEAQRFTGDRRAIREAAVLHALRGLLELAQGSPG